MGRGLRSFPDVELPHELARLHVRWAWALIRGYARLRVRSWHFMSIKTWAVDLMGWSLMPVESECF